MSDDKKEVQIFEDEKKILLDHDYDGIRELDHPLPNWWVTTFALTVAFAIPYYLAHTFFGAQTINEELAADMKELQAKQVVAAPQGDGGGGFNLTEYQAVVADPKSAKLGKKRYKRKCKSCHGKFGEGGIGPNLTDNFWINGDGSLEAVHKVIDKGVVDKGMAAWGETLSKEEVYAVLKYVMDFKGTNPENAKKPQGKEYN